MFPGGVGTNILANSGVAMKRPTPESAGTSLTTPADAAAQIIAAVRKGTYRVRIGRDARMLDRLARLMPRRATDLIANRMKGLLEG